MKKGRTFVSDPADLRRIPYKFEIQIKNDYSDTSFFFMKPYLGKFSSSIMSKIYEKLVKIVIVEGEVFNTPYLSIRPMGDLSFLTIQLDRKKNTDKSSQGITSAANPCHKPEYIELAKEALDLHVDYLDLYLMHSPCVFKQLNPSIGVSGDSFPCENGQVFVDH